ncbi:MAG: hypothetical protein JSR17_08525 [Proteobacteria bacterium]|nr:hypothetical protein [Pseudomonadota bacterium]
MFKKTTFFLLAIINLCWAPLSLGVRDHDAPPILANVELPLPKQIYAFGDNVIKVVFTNQSAQPINLQSVVLSATLDGHDVSNWLTKGTTPGVNDTCSNQNLAPQKTCHVYISVVPQDDGNQLTVKATLSFGMQNVAAVTSSQVITADPTIHMVNFINQCPYPVWLGVSNSDAHVDPLNGSSPDAYKISKQIPGMAPTTKSIKVNQYENGLFWAKTNCKIQNNTLVCNTGSCPTLTNAQGGVTGTCVQKKEPMSPFTRFEAFMSNVPNNDGIYNTSIINGFNLPVEVKGLGNKSAVPSVPAPFDCAASGAVIQPQGSTLGSCSWEFQPPTPAQNFYFVSQGADDNCTSCKSPNLCGMAYNQVNTDGGQAPINRRCGTFQGYWTIASFNYPIATQWGSQNLYNFYALGTPLPAGPDGDYGQGATYANMYGCIVTSNSSLNTGYAQGTPNVCGCYDWNKSQSAVPTAQAANCVKDNADWERVVFPKIVWLKQACPTAYAYQFDDKSSSFQCNPNKGGYTSYQVTFCPGGKTGAPVVMQKAKRS